MSSSSTDPSRTPAPPALLGFVWILSLACGTAALASPAPLSSVELRSFGPLDLAAVAAEDQLRAAAGEPWRFAIPRQVRWTPETHGSWQDLEDGSLRWRLRVAAAGARSLSFGFTRYRLPAGARLRIHAADGSSAIRPFTEADNRPHGELWTPLLATSEAVLELDVPEDLRDRVELELTFVHHGYRGFRGPAAAAPSGPQGLEAHPAASGACNVDVVCPEGNGWRQQIRAVAAFALRGSILCTGTLLNNTAGDLRPYFLTAEHCGISAANDQTVVVYWGYQNSTCRPPGSGASGGAGNGTLDRFQTGATLRAEWDPSDFSLIELDSAPPAAAAAFWAGWDRAGGAPPSAVGIHHPRGDEKRISFENDPLSVTSVFATQSPGNGRYLRITDWDLGTTEPGSSGSPLFNPRGRVIGQLTGGNAACGNDASDWYGRFAASWDGGGTASTRLKDWLDPTGSDAPNLDGRDRPAEEPLEAPTELSAAAVSATRIQLTWVDNSSRERDFLLQIRPAGTTDFTTLRTLPADTTAFLVEGLMPMTQYSFRLRARRGTLRSPFTPAVSATTLSAVPAAPATLTVRALSTTQFELAWQDRSDNETGFAIEVSPDGTSFSPTLVVPPGSTVATAGGFPPLAHRHFRVRARGASADSEPSNTARATTDGPVTPCIPDLETLCLNGGRFRLTVRWTDRDGVTSTGKAQPLTGDTGYFWFFSSTNVELAAKALTGCPNNGHYWIFLSGLTNVGVELLAVDSATGKARTYLNPVRTPFPPIFDTFAFETCP